MGIGSGSGVRLICELFNSFIFYQIEQCAASNCSFVCGDIMCYGIIAIINPWTVVTKSYGKPETIDQREIETYIRFMHFLEKITFIISSTQP